MIDLVSGEESGWEEEDGEGGKGVDGLEVGKAPNKCRFFVLCSWS